MKPTEIKSEKDLDAALHAQGVKKRRNRKRESIAQIVAFAVLALVGIAMLSPSKIGFEVQGALAVTYRIAGLFYVVWAFIGLFVAVRRFKQKAWASATHYSQRLFVVQSVIGLMAVNLVIAAAPLARSIEQGMPDAGELFFVVALLAFVNWFLVRAYRRDYARLQGRGSK